MKAYECDLGSTENPSSSVESIPLRYRTKKIDELETKGSPMSSKKNPLVHLDTSMPISPKGYTRLKSTVEGRPAARASKRRDGRGQSSLKGIGAKLHDEKSGIESATDYLTRWNELEQSTVMRAYLRGKKRKRE